MIFKDHTCESFSQIGNSHLPDSPCKYVPVPKKTGKILLSDLRPMALTSVFSKILERVIVERMTSFLTQCDVISDTQHANRTKRSCNTATFKLTGLIKKETANNKKNVFYS